jgi:hypothetical protein
MKTEMKRAVYAVLVSGLLGVLVGPACGSGDMTTPSCGAQVQCQTSLRPRCATGAYATCDANNVCIFPRLNVGCECHEGQLDACRHTDGSACYDGSCGVRRCIINSDTSSHWDFSTCVMLAH